MAASSTTSTVYLQVIEDVVRKVRHESFNSGAAGDDILRELRGMWEAKMMQGGVILGAVDRPAAKNVSGVPLLLFTILMYHIKGQKSSVDNSMYNIPTGLSDYPTPAQAIGIFGTRPCGLYWGKLAYLTSRHSEAVSPQYDWHSFILVGNTLESHYLITNYIRSQLQWSGLIMDTQIVGMK
ncbi:hypothetical protein SAY86_013508 [Trapa natans]|uniref:Uncharacterized protein n=1 Tax=Trapa natans TaxID=22666 RepID=A0AAN7KLW3_TRANT|nr:hypothetical protein SAY86_013508 [Trapa natans]